MYIYVNTYQYFYQVCAYRVCSVPSLRLVYVYVYTYAQHTHYYLPMSYARIYNIIIYKREKLIGHDRLYYVCACVCVKNKKIIKPYTNELYTYINACVCVCMHNS